MLLSTKLWIEDEANFSSEAFILQAFVMALKVLTFAMSTKEL